MIPIQEAPIKKGTRILVRADLDVPIEKGKILETERLDRMLETFNHIGSREGTPVIAGHIGRPKGVYVEALSTKHLLPYFNEKLGKNTFELLENLRFDPRERNNSEDFVKELAAKAHIYVNDCFSTSHREHASIVGPPKHIVGYAGFRLQKEVSTLNQALKNPKRPLVLIVGGAKLEDKKPVVSKFIEFADHILLGGKVGLDWTENVPENVVLPTDYAEESKDIGPQTIQTFVNIINTAKTVVWAGPMGLYERKKFFTGTEEIAKAVANISSNSSAVSIIGGGDTIAAIDKAGLLDQITFASSGGGAMLTFLSTGTLVGIEALPKEYA